MAGLYFEGFLGRGAVLLFTLHLTLQHNPPGLFVQCTRVCWVSLAALHCSSRCAALCS